MNMGANRFLSGGVGARNIAYNLMFKQFKNVFWGLSNIEKNICRLIWI
jgi:hypothetical protein